MNITISYEPNMAYAKGTTLVVCFLGFLGLTLYPIIINPMINPQKYKEIQRVTRKDIKQEDIQPGNMNVWSDPFAPRKPRKSDDN